MSAVAHAALLTRFAQAWAARDLPGVASCLHDDAVYAASLGPEPGRTFRGKAAVLEGIVAMWAQDDAIRSDTLSQDIFAGAAVVRWRYQRRHPGPDGSRIVLGIDVYAFRDGLIASKDAYRKVALP